MDAVTAYSLASLGWLSAQALPLIVWPSFVVSLVMTEGPVPAVAVYFARALGLGQLALALQTLVLSGLLPLHAVDNDHGSASPYAWAALFVTTLYHGAAAFYSYGCYYYDIHPTVTAFLVGCTGSSILAAIGVWCLLFGEGSRISKRTGADKRTSGFPFTNKEAEKRKVR
ncbi:uncharacterized protein SPSK_09842 [Sporothrix schenckii 1099-18]|nr:uncharacterized protein SPSK_09842 [Sporothrix schenckii 1099-18]KJR84536.1 hypothetical protein SPSK_09842 [Sporothrix schenckii 1099-18]